jgi:crotonobetainyl-CoA:carnitine CoA-transferase CaiB-like acyl-CoA transferase
MASVMEGLRVVELASWTFVPAAGAILADWGADVIKIEHPDAPDPQRSLVRGGLEAGGPNALFEQANRGKRSIAFDLSAPGGMDVLHTLVRSADVFLTNWLPSARAKRGVDLNDIRAVNPTIVYARGHGLGAAGPESDRPGFDSSAYVARGGFGMSLMSAESTWPAVGASAIGDLPGAMTLAGGVGTALFHRERTGVAPVVDVSLLGQALWTIAADAVAAGIRGSDPPKVPREQNPNPLTLQYRTRDGRYIRLAMLQSDRFFGELCRALGAPGVTADPRFHDSAARTANSAECTAALDEVFAALTLDEVRERLSGFDGPWEVAQTPVEVIRDPQVIANGYLHEVPVSGADPVAVVRPPAIFDSQPPAHNTPAPEHGQHTEEILLEVGYDWDDIVRLQGARVLR